ncbi:MAG: hypothetical protein R2912_00565 [Eubacteriales bacterium]
MSARPITTQRGDVRGAFVFALLATFALLSLVVVVVGARSLPHDQRDGRAGVCLAHGHELSAR